MRVAIIGGRTIARLFLEHIKRGDPGAAAVVAIAGRSNVSHGKPLAVEFGVPFVTTLAHLLEHQPDVVVEAASHEAVREYCGPLLDAGAGKSENRLARVLQRAGGIEADDYADTLRHLTQEVKRKR